jgi:hypothetical protein
LAFGVSGFLCPLGLKESTWIVPVIISAPLDALSPSYPID